MKKKFFVYYEDWHGNDRGNEGPFDTRDEAEEAGRDKQDFHNGTWEFTITEELE